MKRLLVFLIVAAACLSFAQDEVRVDDDGWTNHIFLNGLVKLRAPFDLDEFVTEDNPSFVTNPKEQVKTAFYAHRDDKITCAVAVFDAGAEKLKIDLNSKDVDEDDPWFQVSKGSYRTSKKDGWTCLSLDMTLKDGISCWMRLFFDDHKAVMVLVHCQDAKDLEAKKIRKGIADSFVFDMKADKKELASI